MLENFREIDAEIARTLVLECANNQNASGRTGNTKVHIRGDYAIKREKIDDEVVKRLHSISEQGVRVVPVLGYSCDEGTKKGYAIYPKAEGLEMWDDELINDKGYLIRRTTTFAEAPQEHYDKFIKDYKSITESGISVDATRKENFFYDKQKGFSFIDLNSTLDQQQIKQRLQYLPEYGFLPCHQILSSKQNGFSLIDFNPSESRGNSCLLDLSEQELEDLKYKNGIIFEKCKKAILASELITEEQLEECLQKGRAGKTHSPSELPLPPIHIAGLTNKLEVIKKEEREVANNLP